MCVEHLYNPKSFGNMPGRCSSWKVCLLVGGLLIISSSSLAIRKGFPLQVVMAMQQHYCYFCLIARNDNCKKWGVLSHFTVRASRHSAHKRKQIVKFWRKNRKRCTMSCTCLNHDKTLRSIGSVNIYAKSGSRKWFYICNMYYNIYYVTSYDLFYSSRWRFWLEVTRGLILGTLADLQCHVCHYCVWVLFYSCFNLYFGLSGRYFVHVLLSELDMNTPEAVTFLHHRPLAIVFFFSVCFL
jgi:hypothetical protein